MKYTEYLNELAIDDSFDIDESKIIEVVNTFRSQCDVLDIYIDNSGYKGDFSKKEYIESLLKDKEIDGFRCDIDELYKHNTALEKVNGIRLCYAFDLNLEESNEFLKRLCLGRGLYCHKSIDEAVHYFCLKNKISYKDSKRIIENVKNKKANKHEININTQVLQNEIDNCSNVEELQIYLTNNIQFFDDTNVYAKKLIIKLWNEIIDEESGLIKEELTTINSDPIHEDKEIVFNFNRCSPISVLNYIFRYNGIQKDLNDRSLKSIINENPLIHKIAQECFPNRESIGKIINNTKVSDESIRKNLILLQFFSLAVKQKIEYKDFCTEDRKKFIKKINNALLRSGYEELYAGNPYDWIFIYCLYDETDPLERLRCFMSKVDEMKK